MDNKIICVVGPTASGKTALAIEIAKQVGGEIVCADSMQIYKYYNIGTAKPTLEEIAEVPHHLFDFVDPTEDFSVARYVTLADEVISDIKSRGKVPIITGGTGLYVNSLIKGNEFSKNDVENEKLRKELTEMVSIYGNEYIHEMLKEFDAESYEKLHSNDVKRVIRAIEVYKTTGKTISEHNKKTKEQPLKYDATILFLNPHSRELLYERINKRVDIMLDQGILEEIKFIIDNGYFVKTAGQAIGYKELIPYINGEDTLENCIETMKMESRRYAKRQITWFKRVDGIHLIDNLETAIDDATRIVKENFYE